MADAYGFGPERMKKFFIAFQENHDEITRMEKEVDADYAYEKLRLKAERVTGMKIEYLYEHEAQENEHESNPLKTRLCAGADRHRQHLESLAG